MRRVESILGALESSQRRLLSEIEGLQDPRFGELPPGGGWSVAQVIAHLARVEENVARGIDASVAGKAHVKRHWADPLRRLLYLLRLYHFVRVRTAPSLAHPESATRTESLARLAAARARLLASIEAGEPQGLWEHSMRHPIFGPMPMAEMLAFLAYHQERHRLQIVRIKAALERVGR